MPKFAFAPLDRTTLSIVLIVAGLGLSAVALLDWLSYDDFLLSLVWR
jgi:uncharacterized membrane protein YidH (DUF202 family)